MAEQVKYFISYTNRDNAGKKWAKWLDFVLRHDLQAATYVQYYDSIPGEDFRAVIKGELDAGSIVLSVITPSYEGSEICKWEAETAKRFIPLRCESFTPRAWLKDRSYVDLYGKAEAEAVKRLEVGIKGMPRPAERPIFPGGEKPEYPGAVNNLRAHNPLFAGREQELREVDEAFAKHPLVALVAPGGFGKTQIAQEYAYRHWDDYAVIWRFNAASDALLQEGYREFARQVLHMTREATKDWVAVWDAITEWWREHRDYLFLYDNGEGCANLREYLPLEGTQGRALITTREQVGLAIAKAVDVKIFTKEDALAFMQLRLGDAAKDGGTELARALGRLPLALEQAAAYVLVTPCTIAKYLDLLEQYGLDVLEEPSQDTDYDQTVMTTWQITLEKLDSDAEALIMLFAYCAPENIPLQIFIDGREYLPDILKKVLIPNNILAQNALIKKLMRYVLVARENDDQNRPLLSMHSLMQQVLQRNTWALLPCLLVARSASNYSFDTREGFATFSQTWPHAVKIAEKAEMHWVEDEDIQELVAYIYHQAGYGLQQQCDYPQALEWYKKALIIREKVFGKEHQSTAGTCNNIAGIYRVQGKFVEALAGYHYVLDFCEKVLGMEDRYTAITYNNIAGVHDNLHEYTEALEWMKKALAIQEKFAGVERSDTASTYNNIAGIHYALHEYHQALAWNRKALAIREEVLGKEHPSTAITYHNIAEAWAALKKPYKALKWCRKALNIRDKVLGKEHLDTAMTYNSLAHLYYQLGNPNDAAPLLRKAYRVFLRKLGVNHHYTQSTLESARNAHNLAQIPTPFEEWLNQPEPESNC